MSPMRGVSVLAIAVASMLTSAQQGRPADVSRHELRSPDGRIVVTVETGGALRWWASRDGAPFLGPSSAALTVDGRVLGRGVVRHAETARSDTIIQSVFYPRRHAVRDRYAELTLVLDDGLRIILRAYDDGVAYRLRTDIGGDVRIDGEELRLGVPGNPTAYATFADCSRVADKGLDCFHSSFEEPYTVAPARSLPPERRAFLPLLLASPGAAPHVLVTEADLDDYPGLWLRAVEGGLEGQFAPYPLEEVVVGETYPQAAVARRAAHIAETRGRRLYPWRVFALAERDRDLPAHDLVYRLGGETAPGDWSWLTPGKSQSEWLWDNILYDVPFRSGLNTATYRHYIDVAARFGLGYLFFDAGWSAIGDPLTVTPGLDVPGLVREARAKGLGVVLWTSSLAMARELERVLDQFVEWGATGVMVDFMDRDDQPMVGFYRRVVEEAARRRLLVNFHGSYKPTGLERRFPNAVTREGFMASEYHKWSDALTPEYEVTLPFVRGVVGPMDYEPGHMRNAQRESFRPIDRAMMSQGTRMHQAAMYLVYESPYAKMGGNVSDYQREPEFTRFLAGIPTLWRDTRVLDGRIADFVVVLREASDGAVWVGAMTDWEARQLPLPLTFLGDGPYTAELWEDGPNAARHGADWARTARTVTAAGTVTMTMAPGGGWVGRFARQTSPR